MVEKICIPFFLLLVSYTQVKIQFMFVILSLSVSTPGKLKSLLDRGGDRPRPLVCLSNALPMNYELTVRVSYILKLSLVPSISVCLIKIVETH